MVAVAEPVRLIETGQQKLEYENKFPAVLNLLANRHRLS